MANSAPACTTAPGSTDHCTSRAAMGAGTAWAIGAGRSAAGVEGSVSSGSNCANTSSTQRV